jgi:CheY-like chemotaxis protein
MDVQMPEMGGFEATAAILALPGAAARVPIVAMTAHAMDGDRERCLAAGMAGYVAKPVHPEQLFAEIDRVIGDRLTADRVMADRAANGEAAAPAATAAPSPVVLDREVLARNVADDAELLAELVGLFLDECPRLLAEIRASAAAGDPAGIERAAHTLKSAAGSMAGNALSTSAQAVELIARRGALGDTPGAIASLEREAARLAAALRALVPTTPDDATS